MFVVPVAPVIVPPKVIDLPSDALRFNVPSLYMSLRVPPVTPVILPSVSTGVTPILLPLKVTFALFAITLTVPVL